MGRRDSKARIPLLGDVVERHRKRIGASKIALSYGSGMSYNYIGRIARGERLLSTKALSLLASPDLLGDEFALDYLRTLRDIMGAEGHTD